MRKGLEVTSKYKTTAIIISIPLVSKCSDTNNSRSDDLGMDIHLPILRTCFVRVADRLFGSCVRRVFDSSRHAVLGAVLRVK